MNGHASNSPDLIASLLCVLGGRPWLFTTWIESASLVTDEGAPCGHEVDVRYLLQIDGYHCALFPLFLLLVKLGHLIILLIQR